MAINLQYSEISHQCMREPFYLPSCTITDVPSELLQNLKQLDDPSHQLCSLFNQQLEHFDKRIHSFNKTDLSAIVVEEDSVKLVISDGGFLQLEFVGTLKPIDLFQRYTAQKIAGNAHKAFNYLNLLVDQTQDKYHLTELGVCYETGLGVEQSLMEAVKCYQLAADQGYAEAQYQLGSCYLYGIGINNDQAKAYNFFQLAADQGHKKAECEVGLCFSRGRGVKVDLPKAFTYFALSAHKGYEVGQYFLGVCYFHGFGVQKNLVKSVTWMTQSADQGYGHAQLDLGVSYCMAEGCSTNYKKATEYFALAAAQGLPQAQYNMGICYLAGRGVERDLDKAIHCYQQAADQGYEAAINELSDIQNEVENPSNSSGYESALSYSSRETSTRETGGSSIPSVVKNRLGQTLSSLSSSSPSAFQKSKLSLSTIQSKATQTPNTVSAVKTEINPFSKGRLKRISLSKSLDLLQVHSKPKGRERSFAPPDNKAGEMITLLSSQRNYRRASSDSTQMTDFTSISTASDTV